MTEPTRSPDNYRDATERAARECGECGRNGDDFPTCPRPECPARPWAHRYTRSEMTTGEADAWRAAVAECKRKSYEYAANLRASVDGRDDETAAIVRANASAIEMCADQFDRIKPRAEATGLCERGA